MLKIVVVLEFIFLGISIKVSYLINKLNFFNTQNSITSDNPIKACFSNKKYTLNTSDTQIEKRNISY